MDGILQFSPLPVGQDDLTRTGTYVHTWAHARTHQPRSVPASSRWQGAHAQEGQCTFCLCLCHLYFTESSPALGLFS